jgi:ferredoxin
MLRERYTLIFPPECSTKPITYLLIKRFDIEVNILKAEITAGKEGHLLIEMKGESDSLEKGLEFLRKEKINVIPLIKQISIEEDECVHCGACTAVCFSGALKMDRNAWKLDFNPEECVVCGLCVNTCPLKIIKIGFGQEDAYE